MSHFTHETSHNKQATADAARKIYNLYVSEAAPLRVALEDEVFQDIKKVRWEYRLLLLLCCSCLYTFVGKVHCDDAQHIECIHSLSLPSGRIAQRMNED